MELACKMLCIDKPSHLTFLHVSPGPVTGRKMSGCKDISYLQHFFIEKVEDGVGVLLPPSALHLVRPGPSGH